MVSARRYYHDDDVVGYFDEATEGGLTEREQVLVESYFTGQEPTVLDLGCGAGRTTGPLEARGFDVVGLDVSEAMITAARENTSRTELLVGDATDLPFEDEYFDYVLFSRCGLDDIVPERSRYEALREAYRVLRPGGRFAFDSNNAIHRYTFDPTSLEDVRSHLGFLVRNLRAGLIPSRYKQIDYPNGTGTVYGITPRMQRHQLRQCGFTLEAVLQAKPRPRPLHLDPGPYYVARKARP